MRRSSAVQSGNAGAQQGGCRIGGKQTRLLLCAFVLAVSALQQTLPLLGQAEPVVLLSGKVVDRDGNAVAGAQVMLHEPSAKDVIGSTDASGMFQLRTPHQIHYEVSVETADHRRAQVVVEQPEAALRIVVRPTGGTQPEIDFADTPAFTVAGITDWTAVGGHGSDSTLRTSEELARQTATLQHAAPVASPATMKADDLHEAALRRAVSENPQSYAAVHSLGDLYLEEDRYAEASSLLERASQLHGETAPDEYIAALACKGEGDIARAHQHVTHALAQADRPDYHQLAGQLYERLGDPLSAAHEYEKAAGLDPSENNYFAWASELLLHRAIWQAAEVFAKGVQLHPESQRLRTGWGAALFASAKYDEAAGRLCEAFDLDPSNRETFLFLGKLGLGSPSPEECVKEKLTRFLKLRPEDADANFYQAMMLLRGNAPGDRERAKELLRRAAVLKPGFAEAYLQLGVLASSERDNAAAQADFERAIAADPTQAEAHYRLGAIYERTGHPEKARTEFARHEVLIKEQADEIDQERRQVKQFLVVPGGSPSGKKMP